MEKTTEGEFASDEYVHIRPDRVKIKDYIEEWLAVYKNDLKLGGKINYRNTIDWYIVIG